MLMRMCRRLAGNQVRFGAGQPRALPRHRTHGHEVHDVGGRARVSTTHPPLGRRRRMRQGQARGMMSGSNGLLRFPRRPGSVRLDGLVFRHAGGRRWHHRSSSRGRSLPVRCRRREPSHATGPIQVVAAVGGSGWPPPSPAIRSQVVSEAHLPLLVGAATRLATEFGAVC